MNDGKKWLIGAIAVAVAVGVPALLFRSASGPLDKQVESFQAREQAQESAARYQELGKQIEELEGITNDAHFSRLSGQKQDYVRGRLAELRAYQDYDKALDEVPDPNEARNDGQLQQTRKKLTEIAVPASYQADWAKTDAVRRHDALSADVRALDDTAYDLRKGYRRLADEGSEVLKNKDAPGLPGRARQVLEKAKKLPDPQRDRDKTIPGAARVTYGTVFQFAEVAPVYASWERIKKSLEPIAALGEP
ncbi:MAG TPA: hypothetical protein VG013_29040 [Gemmataceae bacterium]|jgi:hypothetical protein|nr:hypothetical protein [Gemmataceae bacterium]